MEDRTDWGLSPDEEVQLLKKQKRKEYRIRGILKLEFENFRLNQMLIWQAWLSPSKERARFRGNYKTYREIFKILHAHETFNSATELHRKNRRIVLLINGILRFVTNNRDIYKQYDVMTYLADFYELLYIWIRDIESDDQMVWTEKGAELILSAPKLTRDEFSLQAEVLSSDLKQYLDMVE